MKKSVCMLLVCSLFVISYSIGVSADSYYQGLQRGERIADNEHSSIRYWLAGLPSAFLFSPMIGGTGTITTAYVRNPSPDNEFLVELEDENKSLDYINGFKAGYENRAQSQNVRAAWGATGVAFILRLAIISNMDDDPNYSNAISTIGIKANANMHTPFNPNEIPILEVSF